MCQIACNNKIASSHFSPTLAAHGWLTTVDKDTIPVCYICANSVINQKAIVIMWQGPLNNAQSVSRVLDLQYFNNGTALEMMTQHLNSVEPASRMTFRKCYIGVLI